MYTENSNYELPPKRIFLDTNVLQYLQDFGEFIFDNYQEKDEYLVSPKGRKILTSSNLYREIDALRMLLIGINRTNIEFAISQNTFEEVKKKRDNNYTRWFFEMWDYWQNILREYEYGEDTVLNPIKLQEFDDDRSLLGRLSKKDSKIIRDAISLDCGAILTVDKFRNLHTEINNKYKIMVLHPTDLWPLLRGVY